MSSITRMTKLEFAEHFWKKGCLLYIHECEDAHVYQLGVVEPYIDPGKKHRVKHFLQFNLSRQCEHEPGIDFWKDVLRMIQGAFTGMDEYSTLAEGISNQ